MLWRVDIDLTRIPVSDADVESPTTSRPVDHASDKLCVLFLNLSHFLFHCEDNVRCSNHLVGTSDINTTPIPSICRSEKNRCTYTVTRTFRWTYLLVDTRATGKPENRVTGVLISTRVSKRYENDLSCFDMIIFKSNIRSGDFGE